MYSDTKRVVKAARSFALREGRGGGSQAAGPDAPRPSEIGCKISNPQFPGGMGAFRSGMSPAVKEFSDMASRNRWVLLAIAWCVALNLRGISLSVSPLLPFIKNDLGLTYVEAGLLFSTPTILMAVFGFPGGWLADTIGMKRTLTLGLVLILAGAALRAAAPGFRMLLLWTALLGAGMGISGPCLTRMVKDRFADLPGTATGIYTTGIIMGATLATWLTYPFLLGWTGSWKGTFLVWSAVALFGLLGWVLLAPSGDGAGGGGPKIAGIWRDRTVWKLNIIFLAQGFVFYSLSSWIPTYYHELGLTLKTSTRILAVFIFLNLPSSLIIPYVSDKTGGTKTSLIVSGAILLPAVFGMIFFPLALTWFYPILMGVAMGGIFALSFALPLKYVEPRLVGSVAGANLLVGYGGTFAGPIVIGWVHDLTGEFTGAGFS